MADNVDATVTGADETRQAFTERWESMTEDDRAKEATDMFSATRGLNRKVSELHAKLDELRGEKATATETTEKAVSSLSDLQSEIAEIRAQKLLVAKQAEMLQKAADHDIDSALAIRFAETTDADGTFELAISEIERRTQTQVNERLGSVPAPKGSPMGESGYDLSRMSQRERDRLPASIRDRAFNDYLTEVV